MVEAKEALLSIKQAEESANRLVEDAKQKATIILREGDTLAEEKYEKILANGKKEAERLTEKGKKEGESEAEHILKKGIKNANLIRSIEEVKLQRAVNLVIERIVYNHGNRQNE